MDIKAILSILIFVGTYFFIAIEKTPKVYVALSGVLLLILLKVYNFEEIHNYVDWDTISFLFGIFLIVRVIEISGFFDIFYLLKIIKKSKFLSMGIIHFCLKISKKKYTQSMIILIKKIKIALI